MRKSIFSLFLISSLISSVAFACFREDLPLEPKAALKKAKEFEYSDNCGFIVSGNGVVYSGIQVNSDLVVTLDEISKEKDTALYFIPEMDFSLEFPRNSQGPRPNIPPLKDSHPNIKNLGEQLKKYSPIGLKSLCIGTENIKGGAMTNHWALLQLKTPRSVKEVKFLQKEDEKDTPITALIFGAVDRLEQNNSVRSKKLSRNSKKKKYSFIQIGQTLTDGGNLYRCNFTFSLSPNTKKYPYVFDERKLPRTTTAHILDDMKGGPIFLENKSGEQVLGALVRGSRSKIRLKMEDFNCEQEFSYSGKSEENVLNKNPRKNAKILDFSYTRSDLHCKVNDLETILELYKNLKKQGKSFSEIKKVLKKKMEEINSLSAVKNGQDAPVIQKMQHSSISAQPRAKSISCEQIPTLVIGSLQTFSTSVYENGAKVVGKVKGFFSWMAHSFL